MDQVLIDYLARWAHFLFGITWIGLQDNLQLIIFLHSVRIVAKTAVVRANAGFNIDDVPRLGAQNT